MYYFRHLVDCEGQNVAPSVKVRYADIVDAPPAPLFDEPCTIEVRNQDAIDATLGLVSGARDKVGVLNLCSPTRPGGGVKIGSRAQEEELFRRTAYHKTLIATFYPISDDELVYSPSVPIVRTKEYHWLGPPHPFAAFLACAGLKWPKVVGGQHFGLESEKECTRRKIRLILHTAYVCGKTDLVLGALGAGCFRGPPRGIAELFRDELESYKHCFRRVVFAILSHDIAPPEHGPLGQVFAEVLCPSEKKETQFPKTHTRSIVSNS